MPENYTFECPHCDRDVIVCDVEELYAGGVFLCPACSHRSRVVRAPRHYGFSYWLDTQPWCCEEGCHEIAIYDVRAPLPHPMHATPQEYGEALDDATMTCARHVTPFFLSGYYKIHKVS